VKAVLLSGFGGVDVLRIGERPDPVPGDGDLLVRVRATALNRADLLQRRGKYPPPEGASDILGLEMAGEVVQAGPATGDFREGDRVCALLPGGGYAQRVSLPAGLAIRLPDRMSFEEGAAIPEAFLTAYRNLFDLGLLAAGGTVLVHAGASGVGTAAIQLIREAGADSLVTAGTPEKIRRCLELGARAGWNRKEGPFAPWIAAQTGGRGVDMVLDCVGAAYFEQNLQSLAEGGKLIVIGMMGGSIAGSLDLALLLTRGLQILGSRIRGMSIDSKVALTKRFTAFAMQRFEDGRLFPVIDSVYDWREVARAHARMEENANLGKIVLRVSE
jgi:putative PIG3 family NAD(P)H quinone oxidoreductase